MTRQSTISRRSAESALSRLTALARMSALRQAMVLALAFVIMTVVAGIVGLAIISNALTDAIDDRLSQTARLLDLATAIETATQSNDDIEGDAIGILDDSGRLIGPMTESAFAELGHNTRFGDDIGLDDDDWRVLVVATSNGRVAVATELETVSETVAIVSSTLATVLALTVIACLGTGLTIGLRAQRRMDRITATLDRFAAGDLDARIGMQRRRFGGADDLDHTASRIDETLDRLQTVLDQMRNLSASMAHELKTPLARLRASLEAAISAVPTEGSDRKLETVVEEADAVIATFDALLRISQLDAGARRDRFGPVDMAVLVSDIADLYRPVIEGDGKTLQVDIDNAHSVGGDRDLIGQLIANLLENTIAHTQSGTAIGVRLSASTLSVWDDGPGIPDSDKKRVLEPFYRTDAAGHGTGLGLAMVRAIADLHGARITIDDHDKTSHDRPGLRIDVQFPVGAVQSPTVSF